MLTLSAIAGLALAAIVIIAVHAKHQYQSAVTTVHGHVEQRRQMILHDDALNDDRLVEALADTERSLAQLLPEYAQRRIELLPATRRERPEWWDTTDLEKFLHQLFYERAKRVGDRLLYQCAVVFVVIVAFAGGLAAWRYHLLSRSPTTTSASSQSDPLSALPEFEIPKP